MLTARENKSGRFQEPDRSECERVIDGQATVTYMWDVCSTLMEEFHFYKQKSCKDEDILILGSQ